MELIIGSIIGFAGVLVASLSLVKSYLKHRDDQQKERGEIVEQLKNLREDVRAGNRAFAVHNVFCREQSEKLALTEKSVGAAHKRIDKAEELLSLHDREIVELKSKRYKELDE